MNIGIRYLNSTNALYMLAFQGPQKEIIFGSLTAVRENLDTRNHW